MNKPAFLRIYKIIRLFLRIEIRATEKRESFCLRDICTSTNFANISLTGRCSFAKASVASDGIRPCFNLYKK